MTINLEDWAGKTVKVTLRNGLSCSATIQHLTNNMDLYELPNFGFSCNLYTSNGRHYRYYDQSSYEIIRIEEITMSTKEILNEINKTQIQLNKLQEQLKQAEAQEKFNSEFYTPIAVEDEYKECLEFLKTESYTRLIGCFAWDQTPQGIGYWSDIHRGKKELSVSDYEQIKDWVINYLIQNEV